MLVTTATYTLGFAPAAIAAGGDYSGDGAPDIYVGGAAGAAFLSSAGGGFVLDNIGGFSNSVTHAVMAGGRLGLVANAVSVFIQSHFGGNGFSLPPGATIHDLEVGSVANTADILLSVSGPNSGIQWENGALLVASPDPRNFALGDFTGDGDAELLILQGDRSLTAHQGGALFAFSPISVGTVAPADDLALADLDGDGLADLITIDYLTGDIRTYLWDPVGAQFAAADLVDLAPGAYVLETGDFDGDGNRDVAVAGGATVSILDGDGAGGLSAGVAATLANTVSALAAADLDGDGRDDLVAGQANGVVLLSDIDLAIAADAPAVRPEGQSGVTAYTFTVTRYDTSGPASATWAVTGFGAAPASAGDFQGGVMPSGTVNFVNGQATATITVLVVGDGNVEADEGFQVTLSSGGGLYVSPATATAAIQNDDSAPTPRPPPRVIPTAGGPGNDLAVLDDTPPTYTAGDGDDLVAADGGNDTVHGNLGADTLYGGLGEDIVRGGQGGDVLYGEDGSDLLFGDKGDDLIHGGRGDDVIEGGEGSDAIVGGQGDDVLLGGAGDDLLSGDRGNDRLSGGPGADVFRIFGAGGADIVTDFSAAEGDRVQVTGTYTLRQSGADVIIHLGPGDSLTLQHVQLADLPTGWIFS